MNSYSTHTDCIVLLGSKHLWMGSWINDVKREKGEDYLKEGSAQDGMEMRY